MITLNKKSFKLPRVEKDKFILLLRLGLEYNRETQAYQIINFNNIEKLKIEISNIIGKEVAFLQTCKTCGKDIQCTECKYYDKCSTKNLPFCCICEKCLKEGPTITNQSSF